MSRPWRDLASVATLFLAGNRAILASGLLLSSATALCGVALLGLSGWFITATAVAGLSVATALTFDVFAPSAGIRFLALARTASRYGERLTTHDATLGVLAALRERLFRGWAQPGAAGDLSKRPARLLFRLTLDIDALDSLYLRVAVPLVAAIAVALASGTALGFLDPLFGFAVAVLLLCAGVGLPAAAAIAARRPAVRRTHALESLRGQVIELVTGQAELAIAGQLGARRDGLGAIDRELARCDEALNGIETRVGVGFGIVGAVLLAGTLVAMAHLVEADAISAPLAALGLLIALAALEPFAALRRGAIELGRTLLASRRIAPRLAPACSPATRVAPPDGTALRLSAVSVRHAAARRARLCDVSLTIADGARVAVIGPSGAGKSTLLALLAGELDVTSGRVERRRATLLTQRTELFQDSLRDNLLLADPNADDAHLLAALDSAGLLRDIAALPSGLDTRLGEGGFGLSGGQARRLALARLFLHDTPLWLLDEPTEGLDGATARDVLARLDRRAGKRCVVTATHVRREAEAADRLVVLDRGEVVGVFARGSPDFDTAMASLRPD
jgi:ATP-binding cassette subfamily C protein CydC